MFDVRITDQISVSEDDSGPSMQKTLGFGGDWGQGEGVAVSWSTGNMMVVAGGETPRTALRTRRTTVCQVLC